jgi:hypothetical protein
MIEHPVQQKQPSDTVLHDLPTQASAMLGHVSVHSGTFAAQLTTNDEVIEGSSPESHKPATLADHRRSRIPVAWRSRRIIESGNTTAAKVSTRSIPQPQAHTLEVDGARDERQPSNPASQATVLVRFPFRTRVRLCKHRRSVPGIPTALCNKY